MKKVTTVLLLTSLAAFPALALSGKNSKQADATNMVYVDFGPGVFNPSQDITPEDKFQPDKYSISYRDGAFMLFPNKNLYQGIATNTIVPSNELVDSNFTKIRVYTSEVTYKTINQYFARGDNSVCYNIRSDASQNFSIYVDKTQITSENLYKISFEEGFVLPYPSTDHSTKYVLKESVSFVNRYYGMAGHGDLVYSDEWTRISSAQQDEGDEEEEGIVLEDVAAFSRTVGNAAGSKKEDYRLQIRGQHITTEDFSIPGKLDIDDNSCRLYIFFGDNDFNPEIRGQYNITIPYGKMDLSDSPTSYLNTMYNRVLFTTQDDTVLTLKDVADPTTKGLPTYNAAGENGCLVFTIGNLDNDSLPNYNGRSFKQVTILRGAQFPSYRYTHLNTKAEYRYQQVDDISVELSNSQAVWSTTALYAFNAADINITSVGARKVNINTPELQLNSVVVDIGLSECNYEGTANKQILTVGEKLTRYIYINGRAIYYAFDAKDINAYANLDGKTNTISIVLPLNETSEITEIIVQRGCSIPSLVASTITMEIYGGYVSYYVLSTASYALKDGTYQETEKIYWTLWFDGKNPIRVQNTKTFDFSESAPKGESNERQRFVKWINESGEDAVGYKRINDMSSKEFFGVYIYSQVVQFKNIEKEFSVMVERFTRLTSVDEVKEILVPKKKGFVFQGWVDEEGNHYNMDNRVKRDLVLTATWIEDPNASASQNNTALLIATISIASVAVLVIGGDVVLFFLRRKRLKS